MPQNIFSGPLTMMLLGLQLFFTAGHTKVMNHVSSPTPNLNPPQHSSGTTYQPWLWPWL
uniref:ATP synthase F0 subunit 8 n=1 Tax=Bovichtus angustifrons TaxID=1987354 RepID=A0A898NPE8_9TELE|nr:ATP synthase F0 subunit 8 [Bovichtus angustifrons]QSJ54388.1 ATP synthase F0 subunit 8 [Bovichtus angustifrons]